MKNFLYQLIYRPYLLVLNLKKISLNIFFMLNPALDISWSASIDSGARISAFDGGNIKIGENCYIGRGAKIEAKGGIINIGSNVFIGDYSIIVSQREVVIGDDCQIAENVIIRDQDHKFDNRPIRTSGFNAAPILIENDVWIGSQSIILKRSKLLKGSIIGANSLVNSTINPFELAAGTPAKPIKQLNNPD